jgi:glyoxylate/hydroxypyruvate reductase
LSSIGLVGVLFFLSNIMLNLLKTRVPSTVFQQQLTYFHSSAFVSAGKKVVATRKLLKQSQERLEKQGFELVQWPQDSSMPRDILLKDIQGAEGLICMLSDKIDKQVFKAAGINNKPPPTF